MLPYECDSWLNWLLPFCWIFSWSQSFKVMNNTERNILVTKSLPYILNKPLGINLEKWNYQLLKILEIFCPLALQKVCVSVCRLCIGHAWVPPSPSPCASQPLVCLVGCAFMPVGVLLLRWTSGLGKHWVPVRGLGPWMFKTYVRAELRDSGAYSSNLEN